MNRILLLYVKIESKSSALDIRGSSGEERGVFVVSSLSYGRAVELLWSNLIWSLIVFENYKRNKLNSERFVTPEFDTPLPNHSMKRTWEYGFDVDSLRGLLPSTSIFVHATWGGVPNFDTPLVSSMGM